VAVGLSGSAMTVAITEQPISGSQRRRRPYRCQETHYRSPGL
jgi:hypothetical protein